jgi:hypothetical protein
MPSIQRLAAYAFLALFAIGSGTSVASAANCCRCLVDGKALCITAPPVGNCAAVGAGSNADLKGVTCTDLDLAQCKSIAQGGRCEAGPTDAIAYKKGTEKTFKFEPTIPVLNVYIPGLVFDREVDSSKGVASIPFLAQYISAVYKYLLGISVITAAVMIVYGGFKYVMGATVPAISSGKETIQDAVIGLVILFSSVTILNTINPNLQPGLLKVDILEPIEMPAFADPHVSAVDLDPGLESGSLSANPDVITAITEAAKAFRMDPCILLSHCSHESGLIADMWNGKPRGNPKEKAGYFGLCGVGLMHLTATNVAKLKKLDPSVPDPGVDKDDNRDAKIAWLLTPKGGALAGAMVMNTALITGKGNEFYGLGNFTAGQGSMSNAQKLHNCVVQPLTFKDALARRMSAEDVKRLSCIYDYVAISSGEACTGDQGICSDPKLDEKAQWVGKCASTGKSCFAMNTGKVVDYNLKQYRAMMDKYKCDQ